MQEGYKATWLLQMGHSSPVFQEKNQNVLWMLNPEVRAHFPSPEVVPIKVY